MLLIFNKNNLIILMEQSAKQKLQELLLELQGNMPQRQFARIVGVAHSSLASWLRGDTFPTYESLERIARAAHISTDELLQRLRGEVELQSVHLAEDLLPQINALSRKEKLRLLKFLANQLVED